MPKYIPQAEMCKARKDLDVYGTCMLKVGEDGFTAERISMKDYLIVKVDEPLDVQRGKDAVKGLTGHDVFKPGKPLPPLFAEEADTIPGHPEVDAPFVDGKYVPAPTQHPDVGVGGFNQAINPKDAAGSKKVAFRYILWAPLILVMRALKNGAQKYGPFNWRTGPKISRVTYVEAAIRHLAADLDGETIDPESGELRTPHIAAAIAGLMVALDAESVGQLEDDRGTPGNVADMIRAETKQ